MLLLRLTAVFALAAGLVAPPAPRVRDWRLRATVVVLDSYTATAHLDGAASAWRAADDDVAVYERTAPGDVAARLAGAEVAVTNKVEITAAVLAAAPSLRLVSVTATGTNNVDLAACAARGVAVCNVPAYSTASVAQHVAACHLRGAPRSCSTSLQHGLDTTVFRVFEKLSETPVCRTWVCESFSQFEEDGV